MGLSIHLLGPPRMERGGSAVDAARGHKAWGLLAYLVRSRVPPSRERVAGLLFPEADDPLRALRWTLSALRTPAGRRRRARRRSRPPDAAARARSSTSTSSAGDPGRRPSRFPVSATSCSTGWRSAPARASRCGSRASAVTSRGRPAPSSIRLRSRCSPAARAPKRRITPPQLVRLNPYEENAHVLLVRCLRAAGTPRPRRVTSRRAPSSSGASSGIEPTAALRTATAAPQVAVAARVSGARDRPGAARGRRGRARRRRRRSRSAPPARRRRRRSRGRRPRAPRQGARRAGRRARPLGPRHGRGRRRRAARRNRARGAGRAARRRRDGMARDQLGAVPAGALRASGGVAGEHRRVRRGQRRGARLGRADPGRLPARRGGLRRLRATLLRSALARATRLERRPAARPGPHAAGRFHLLRGEIEDAAPTSSTRPSKRSRREA